MSPYDSTAGADTVTPKTATIHGGSEQMARNMLVAMRLQRRQRDLCWEVGCLVIVNEAQNYDVAAFRVDSSARSGKPGWGDNQFANPLRAKKATYLVKLAETASCELPVRFELRHVETREVIAIEGRTNLCKTPHSVSMIRLKVVKPTVTVGDDSSSE